MYASHTYFEQFRTTQKIGPRAGALFTVHIRSACSRLALSRAIN